MIWDFDVQPDQGVSLVELAVGHWVYWTQFAGANEHTYDKVLVPLDQTGEAERVLPRAGKLLDSEGEGILLRVLSTKGPGLVTGDHIQRRVGRNHRDRAEAMNYLQGVARLFKEASNRWRCDVIEAPSVADGIAYYAVREEVDLIAMYTHDRKGLAKLIKGNIADNVRHKTPVEVRLFRSRELALT